MEFIFMLQRITYKSDMGHKKQVEDVLDILQKEIITPKDDIPLDEMFLIPPLPPSRAIGANFIDIKYFLRVSFFNNCFYS